LHPHWRIPHFKEEFLPLREKLLRKIEEALNQRDDDGEAA
jgi:hypothetical protein